MNIKSFILIICIISKAKKIPNHGWVLPFKHHIQVLNGRFLLVGAYRFAGTYQVSVTIGIIDP